MPRTFVVLALSALASLANPALAATYTPSNVGTLLADDGHASKGGKQKNHAKDEDDDARDESSEALRSGKHYEVVGELLGFAVAPIPSFGIAAGYFLAPDMVLEASYTSGSIDLLIFKIISQTFEVRLKKFWGNSFYTNVGLGERKIGATFDFSSLTSAAGIPSAGSGEISSTSLTANLAIGNQWQWENFTLGCDWIGFMAPVARLATKDDFPSNDTADTSDKDSLNRLALQGTPQVLRLYLGASF